MNRTFRKMSALAVALSASVAMSLPQSYAGEKGKASGKHKTNDQEKHGRHAGELPAGLQRHVDNKGELPSGLQRKKDEQGSLTRGLERGGKRLTTATEGKKGGKYK